MRVWNTLEYLRQYLCIIIWRSIRRSQLKNSNTHTHSQKSATQTRQLQSEWMRACLKLKINLLILWWGSNKTLLWKILDSCSRADWKWWLGFILALTRALKVAQTAMRTEQINILLSSWKMKIQKLRWIWVYSLLSSPITQMMMMNSRAHPELLPGAEETSESEVWLVWPNLHLNL